MSRDASRPSSIPGVVEVTRIGAGSEEAAPAGMLIEIPHGATSRSHFRSLRSRLVGTFPDDLEQFFFVNTDVGAPEAAQVIAAELAAEPPPGRPDLEVLVVRGLIPRTFIDCNRKLDTVANYAGTGITPGLPEYVSDPADIELLDGLYRDYQRVARAAYREVCGNGGSALTLHTYAPREVRIDHIDSGIVQALREAYSGDVYESWSVRPDVDLITQATDGTVLAPAGLVEAIRNGYGEIGVEVTENRTYRLDASTMGYANSAEWPQRVVCVEISRARLADPFDPFAEMQIGTAKARHMAAPLVRAFRAELSRR